MTDGRAIMSDGCEIAWESSADPGGPVLLLSNSLGTTRHMWSPQVAAFSAGRRLLRYDARGHGQSDAPSGEYTLDRLGRDVVELLDFLNVGVVDFCGLSLGGMVGQWLALNAGARIRKLVIANSSPYMGPPSAWHDRIARVRRKGMHFIAEATLERWFTDGFRQAEPKAVAVIIDMLLTMTRDGYCGCCSAIAGMDMRAKLGGIGQPTLIIGGLFDPATPPQDHSRVLAGGIRGSRLIELPCAHLSNVECAREFTDSVLRFLVGDR